MITRTHNAYHLGDNLVHLNFLRKVALSNPDRQFVHTAQWQYLKQLKDVVVDVPNITLLPFDYLLPADSIDAWRGAKQFWYSHPDRNDFVKFHVEAWFPYLADRMNVENPIKCAKDMLFDYPSIQESLPGDVAPFDVMIINSRPGSGQFQSYEEHSFLDIRKRLENRGWSVYMTNVPQQFGLSVTQIGHLSLLCHTIVMVSTGPSWPTFNVWNQESVKNRIILLEPERVNLSPNTMHCATVDEAAEVLKGSGLL